MINYTKDQYYKSIDYKKVICVNFDDTICLNDWPNIGAEIPFAIDVLKRLAENGHKLILHTQRDENYPICSKELKKYAQEVENNESATYVDILTPAIEFCEERGLEFYDVNTNSNWEDYTGDECRRVYCDFFIDSRAIASQLLKFTTKRGKEYKFINWFKLDEICLKLELYKEPAIKMSYVEFLYKVDEWINNL